MHETGHTLLVVNCHVAVTWCFCGTGKRELNTEKGLTWQWLFPQHNLPGLLNSACKTNSAQPL